MSADRLREAAKVLRERAERSARCNPPPWTGRVMVEDCRCCPQHEVGDAEGDGVIDPWQVTEENGTYIATMHPGVGLALAKLLAATAAIVEGHHGDGFTDVDWYSEELAVADAILGSAE